MCGRLTEPCGKGTQDRNEDDDNRRVVQKSAGCSHKDQADNCHETRAPATDAQKGLRRTIQCAGLHKSLAYDQKGNDGHKRRFCEAG